MKTPTVIADAGVIMGLIYEHDQWHLWATERAFDFAPPLLTCEAAITETTFLLNKFPAGRSKLLVLIERGDIQIAFSLGDEISNIRALMTKYADIPMSLADACLVRMSELYEDALVFTVDSDFLVYRKHRRKKIPLISPF